MFSRLFWIATPFVYWLALLTGTVHSLDTLFPAALRSQLKIGTKSLNKSCERAGKVLRKSPRLSHPDIYHSQWRRFRALHPLTSLRVATKQSSTKH